MKLNKKILIFALVMTLMVLLLNNVLSDLNETNVAVENVSAVAEDVTEPIDLSANLSGNLISSQTTGPIKEILAKEKDFIKLLPEAKDPDNDPVKYYFSAPFNEKGEWQTDINSAGTYETEIIASDGINQIVQKVKIIVENTNQAPYLTENKLFFKELETIDLKKYVTDPDKDPLVYVFSQPFDKNGIWIPGYGDEGNFVTNFKVSDGEFKIDFRIEINVVNTNQPPEITNAFSISNQISIQENQTLEFWVEAEDSDKNQLTYRWKLDEVEIETDYFGEYLFDYQSAGEHQLNLTINDGAESTERSWKIKVENVNRQPKINLLPINVKEGDKIILDLPKKDLDEDKLTYSFEFPLDEKGQWQTNYQDAGKYLLNFTVTDDLEIVKEQIEINILDVDLAPILKLPSEIGVKEGENFSWTIPVEDPDKDEITINLENLPAGAVFNPETKTISWNPNYNYLKRKYGFFSNFLNFLRLENYLISKTTLPINIQACGKDLCHSGILNLTIHNVNRAPVYTNLPSEINITETETLILKPIAEDHDGDLIRYSFSEPLGKFSGKWKTDYHDTANYVVYVAANDGKLTTTLPVKINVLPKNQAPSLKIKNDEIMVNEGQEISFKVSANDPDKEDQLVIKLDNLPSGAVFNDGLFTWTPDYNTVQNKTISWKNKIISRSDSFNRKFSSDKSIVWLNFVANDGTIDIGYPVKVTVKNVNQAPIIVNSTPEQEKITTYVNQPVIFKFKVKDPDQEKLSYTWDFGWGSQEVKSTDMIKRNFTSTGTKTVKVVVSDGFEKVEKEWKIEVVSKPVKKVVQKNNTVQTKTQTPVVKKTEPVAKTVVKSPEPQPQPEPATEPIKTEPPKPAYKAKVYEVN